MDARHQIGAKRTMHRPVSGDTGHRREGLGPDADVEMGLSAFAPPCVAAMVFAHILDPQFSGRESRAQR